MLRAMMTTVQPLALRLLPGTALGKAILVLGGSLLVALAAQVRIDLPGSPVPITGQTFAVLLVGAALGSRLGFLGLLAYLAEGSAGLPVFAGGTSAWSPSSVPGVPVAFGPTAGYLVGFVVAAFAVGWLAEHGWDRRVWTAMIAMLIGDAIVYPFGLAGLARFVPADQLLAFGFAPFVAGDLYKIAGAALALPTAWRFVRPR